MSIPNFIDKIKSKVNIDKTTLMHILVVTGVGLCSFGLGRISIEDRVFDNSAMDTDLNISFVKDSNEEGNTMEKSNTQKDEEKRYVASKNGKMYYSLGCSGAKRINIENEVWFKTREDAEKSGYLFSSTCK